MAQPPPYTNLDDFVNNGLTRHTTLPGGADPCPTCYEKYKPGESIVETRSCSAGHIFHEKCLLEWLRDYNNNSCPYCRHVFFPSVETQLWGRVRLSLELVDRAATLARWQLRFADEQTPVGEAYRSFVQALAASRESLQRAEQGLEQLDWGGMDEMFRLSVTINEAIYGR